MKYKLDTTRMGMLIFLGVVLTALWLVAAYGFYKENERAKYDVEISPGTVSYGTHSTALMPTAVSPTKHALPMLSGGAIRSYAHSGHATMPAETASQGQLHTTSSAKVKTIGSGGSNGGAISATATASHRAERGINYNSGSTSIPVIAMLSTTPTSMQTTEDRRFAPGYRKAKPSDSNPGLPGEWSDNGMGDKDWYKWNGSSWVAPVYGDLRFDAILGYVVVWDGTAWIKYVESEFIPVGPMPWLLMLLLAVGYGISKRRQHLLNT